MEINEIKNIFLNCGTEISDAEAKKFLTYAGMLTDYNTRINLTAITDTAEIMRLHFADSLLPLGLIPEGADCADVGSGAGFPGVPLAIMRPDIKMTLIEPIKKRTDFLSALVEKLSLENCTVLRCRAEECTEMREKFDIVLSRAVSGLNILCEYCLPLVAVGGHMAALKSKLAAEELSNAGNAINILGGSDAKIIGSDERNVIYIAKTSTTPEKYPRRTGIPEKRPL